MSRFLYSDKDNAVIRFLVASELFTEFYLRRRFCWYNCELWLEDFIKDDDDNKNDSSENNNNPDHWTIVLSGCDEIVPSSVVQEHVSSLGMKNCNLVYWPHAKHANCVMSPHRWKLVKSYLQLQQPTTTAAVAVVDGDNDKVKGE
eukprot:CAMPEP_0198154972 /NCGR_PEP_ID=MMETSP1443-20131203/68887_1 /TAXON_ID=186043 /ORGANISM="Entomoneis sp., Strain CCMP2396" /LENGTH=144 /DNA_ID=CAMNT_0043821691 /DNA_START=583 /DNA_END=1017 /DNA_ORIENTATION=+